MTDRNKVTKMRGVFCAIILATGLMGCGNNVNTSVDAGMAAVKEQKYEEALTLFEKAVVDGEDFELAYRGQGLAYMGLTQYENAVTSFEKALSEAGMFPSDLEYDINFYMATAKYKSGDVMGAIDIFDNILEMKDDHKDAYFLRGSAWMKLNEYEKGNADLKKAIELSKSSTDMVIAVYEVLANYGYTEEGNAYLNSLLETNLSKMSEYEKGKVYYYLEDYDNARNSLETAKNEEKGEEATILLMLGKTYEKLGDSEYAAVLYMNYLDENEGNAEIYNQLGLCKLEAGEYREALTAFEAGLAIEGNALVQSLSYNQIVAYEYLGDFSTAETLMKQYLASYPDDEAANREYIFLKSR